MGSFQRCNCFITVNASGYCGWIHFVLRERKCKLSWRNSRRSNNVLVLSNSRGIWPRYFTLLRGEKIQHLHLYLPKSAIVCSSFINSQRIIWHSCSCLVTHCCNENVIFDFVFQNQAGIFHWTVRSIKNQTCHCDECVRCGSEQCTTHTQGPAHMWSKGSSNELCNMEGLFFTASLSQQKWVTGQSL